MQQTAEFLFAIGSILLLGLATDFLGRRTFLPRVTLLLAFGIAVGDEVLGMIPETLSNRFDLITDMALLMIGFLLGGKLSFKSLKQEGRQLLWLSISASLGTTVIVTLALVAASVPLEIDIEANLGLIGAVYLLARIGGKLLGVWVGARASHANKDVRRWMGLALMPQAGVAIGMALLTANRFPEYQ